MGNTLVPRRFIETDDESRNGPTKLSLLELLTHHFHLKGGTARAKQLLLRAQTRNFSAGEQFEQLKSEFFRHHRRQKGGMIQHQRLLAASFCFRYYRRTSVYPLLRKGFRRWYKRALRLPVRKKGADRTPSQKDHTAAKRTISFKSLLNVSRVNKTFVRPQRLPPLPEVKVQDSQEPAKIKTLDIVVYAPLGGWGVNDPQFCIVVSQSVKREACTVYFGSQRRGLHSCKLSELRKCEKSFKQDKIWVEMAFTRFLLRTKRFVLNNLDGVVKPTLSPTLKTKRVPIGSHVNVQTSIDVDNVLHNVNLVLRNVMLTGKRSFIASQVMRWCKDCLTDESLQFDEHDAFPFLFVKVPIIPSLNIELQSVWENKTVLSNLWRSACVYASNIRNVEDLLLNVMFTLNFSTYKSWHDQEGYHKF